MNEDKVREEVEVFKAEYPQYTDEHVSDYIKLLDDYTKEEIQLFLAMLGY